MSTGDTTWLWKRQKRNAYQSRGSGNWMDPYGSGNGWLCVIPTVVDSPRLATLGTSVDTRILPPHCRTKKAYSCSDLHIRHATNSRLSPDKVKALGPDCDISPHPVREVPLDLSIPYINMLLGPQKTARGQANNMVKQEESQTMEESQTQTTVLPAPASVSLGNRF